jgi:hypothetical protein
MDNPLKQILTNAAEGLLYPSESDYPFQFVEWDTCGKRLTKKLIRELTGQRNTAPVKSLSLDDFFRNVTEIKDWYGEQEKADTERFRQLQEILQHHLSGIRVLKWAK